MTEKVELAEQVPLKSDTEATGGLAEAGDVEAAAKPEKKKYFWKKSKTTVETTVEEGEPKKEGEKKCWWSRKCNKEQQEPSFGFDLVNRDEKGLQTNVDLGFSDIFAEPDATRSFNGVWKSTNSVFNGVRNFVYKLLTTIFAIPLAIFFGILFGLASAFNVFICVPLARLLRIPALWLYTVWNFVVGAVFDPLFRSCGLTLSGVTVRQYGINTELTQPITA